MNHTINDFRVRNKNISRKIILINFQAQIIKINSTVREPVLVRF